MALIPTFPTLFSLRVEKETLQQLTTPNIFCVTRAKKIVLCAMYYQVVMKNTVCLPFCTLSTFLQTTGKSQLSTANIRTFSSIYTPDKHGVSNLFTGLVVYPHKIKLDAPERILNEQRAHMAGETKPENYLQDAS